MSFVDFRDSGPPPQLAPLDIPDFFTRPRNQSLTGQQRPVPNRISPIAEDSPTRESSTGDDESYTSTALTSSHDPRSESVQSSLHSDPDHPPRDPSSSHSGSTQGEKSGILAGLRSAFSPDSTKSRSLRSNPRTQLPIPAGGGRRAYAAPPPITKPKGKVNNKEKKSGGGGRRSSNANPPLLKSPASPNMEQAFPGHRGPGGYPPYTNGNGSGSGRFHDRDTFSARTDSPRHFDHTDGSDSSSGSIPCNIGYNTGDRQAETPVPGPSRTLERTSSFRGSNSCRSISCPLER